jgi:hypothetical protein
LCHGFRAEPGSSDGQGCEDERTTMTAYHGKSPRLPRRERYECAATGGSAR